MARLTESKIKKVNDNNFLAGITLKSTLLSEIPDRTIMFGTKNIITVDKTRVVIRTTIIADTEESHTDTNNMLSILTGMGYWTELESYTEPDNAGYYTIGELSLPYDKQELAEIHVNSIAGVSVTTLSFNIALSEGLSTMYTVTLNYVAEKDWLHGLSPFSGKKLTVTQLEKFLPKLVDNSFGQRPAIIRYFILGKSPESQAVVHLVNTDLSNFLGINTESKVLLFNTPYARLGLDYTEARGEFSITQEGFNLKITLKNKAVLELFI